MASPDNAYLDGLEGDWAMVGTVRSQPVRYRAQGVRVVATGRRDGRRLVIHVPYAEGAFGDTFTFDPNSRAWSLLLEVRERDGAWSTFASYRRVHPVAVDDASPVRR